MKKYLYVFLVSLLINTASLPLLAMEDERKEERGAGVFLWTYDEKNTQKGPYCLLLQRAKYRAEESGWANPGGLLDDENEKKHPFIGAVREAYEETVETYKISPQQLAQLPSTTLTTTERELTRIYTMYFARVPYRDRGYLLGKLNSACDPHLKEANDFQWINLVSFVNNLKEGPIFVQNINQKNLKVTLLRDLWRNLQQNSSQKILQEIIETPKKFKVVPLEKSRRDDGRIEEVYGLEKIRQYSDNKKNSPEKRSLLVFDIDDTLITLENDGYKLIESTTSTIIQALQEKHICFAQTSRPYQITQGIQDELKKVDIDFSSSAKHFSLKAEVPHEVVDSRRSFYQGVLFSGLSDKGPLLCQFLEERGFLSEDAPYLEITFVDDLIGNLRSIADVFKKYKKRVTLNLFHYNKPGEASRLAPFSDSIELKEKESNIFSLQAVRKSLLNREIEKGLQASLPSSPFSVHPQTYSEAHCKVLKNGQYKDKGVPEILKELVSDYFHIDPPKQGEDPLPSNVIKEKEIRLLEILKAAYEEEKAHPDKVSLYHATRSDSFFLTLIYSTMRKIVDLSSTESWALRIIERHFLPYKNVEAFKKEMDKQQLQSPDILYNYLPGYQSVGLAVNLSLLGNYNHLNSSTIHFLNNARVSEAFDYRDYVQKVYESLGIKIDGDLKEYIRTHYDPIFKKFFGSPSDECHKNNAYLLQFLVDLSEIDEIVYLSERWGYPIQGLEKPSEFIREFRQFPQNQEEMVRKSKTKIFTHQRDLKTMKLREDLVKNHPNFESKDFVCTDIVEARLLLSPDILKDPRKVKINAFPVQRGIIMKEIMKELQSQLTKDLGRWLHSRSANDQTFIHQPPLKKFHDLIEKSITGQNLPSVSSDVDIQTSINSLNIHFKSPRPKMSDQDVKHWVEILEKNVSHFNQAKKLPKGFIRLLENLHKKEKTECLNSLLVKISPITKYTCDKKEIKELVQDGQFFILDHLRNNQIISYEDYLLGLLNGDCHCSLAGSEMESRLKEVIEYYKDASCRQDFLGFQENGSTLFHQGAFYNKYTREVYSPFFSKLLEGFSNEELKKIINVQDEEGRTILHRTAFSYHEDVYERLSKIEGANLELKDKDQDTAQETRQIYIRRTIKTNSD